MSGLAVFAVASFAGGLAQREWQAIAARCLQGLGAGGVFVALGMAWFSRISVDGSFLADVLGPSLLAATGLGLSFRIAILASVAASVATDGAAGRERAAQLAALTDGFRAAFLVGAGFAAAAAVAAALLVDGRSPPSASSRGDNER